MDLILFEEHYLAKDYPFRTMRLRLSLHVHLGRRACPSLLLSVVLLQSCTSPVAVADFAENARQVADRGAAVFGDLHGSCMRRHAAVRPVSPVFFPTAIRRVGAGTRPDSTACSDFDREGDSLSKASRILGSYFQAMRQLALFDTTRISGAGERTATGIAAVGRLDSTQVDCLSKLSSLITEVITDRFRQHDLKKLLSQADRSISSITNAMELIAGEDYQSLLREERQTLAAQYQAVADVKIPAGILLLNRAYTDDLNQLEVRKAAADALVEALHQVRDGHHTLATSSSRLKAKELAVALQSYTDKLQLLLPTLEKHL